MDTLNVIELTRKMVAMNTVSRLENLILVDFIKGVLTAMGFRVDLQIREFEHGSIKKANLIAWLGPPDGESLMLSAHTDTVPLGQMDQWETDPLRLVDRHGKLYGRGSVDMKGSIAAMMCAVEPLVQRKWRRGLILCLTFDEEVGLVGAKHLVDSGIVHPTWALIGEPTMMKPIRIHKGHIYLNATCQGRSGHGSDPSSGINAIELGMEVIGILRVFRDELRAVCCEETDPPYATINVGLINGGSRANVIPESCTIGFDIRLIPGQKPPAIIDDLRARLETISKKGGQSLVSLELTRIPTDPVCTSSDSEIVRVAEAVTGQTAGGVSYGTDASMLQHLGTQCVILGPGDIKQAHKPNEYVTIDQLSLAVKQFREIVTRMCLE